MPMRTVVLTLLMILLPHSAKTLELTVLDSGRSVSLPLNETLTIALEGKPATGFAWEVSSLDRKVLSTEAAPAYNPESLLPGAGGTYTFRFNPRQQGATTVKLAYRRPWEKGVKPLKTFELSVSVTAAEQRYTRAF